MARTSAWLHGHKTASLSSRLFNSKQVLSGGKQSTAAKARGLRLFCEHSRSHGMGSKD